MSETFLISESQNLIKVALATILTKQITCICFI